MAVVVSVLALAVGAAPAAAGDSPCPNNQTMLPASSSDPPYQCAEMHNSGTIKLSSWETDSWTNSPGAGYYNKTTCKYESSKDVDITAVDAGSGLGSWTATATNWDIDKHHHYAAGVLWATGNVDSGGYSSGCVDDDNTGVIKNSILVLSSLSLSGVPSTATVGKSVTLTATVSPSDATGAVLLLANDAPAGQGSLSSGKATISWTPTASGSQSLYAVYHYDSSAQTIGDRRVSCPSTSKTCGWTAAQSDSYKVTVNAAAHKVRANATAFGMPAVTAPAAGLRSVPRAPALSPANATVHTQARASMPTGLVTRTRSHEMPADLSLACQSGQVPMHAEARTRGHGPKPLVRFKGSVPVVVDSEHLRGRHVSLQLSCRDRGAKLLSGRHLTLGTRGADKIKTRRTFSGIFGGPGADRLSMATRGSFAHGGLGADRIKVKAADDVATGGPGRDRLTATGSGRALLVGGQDRDTLIGARGPTYINAVDGAGGDRVICRSRANKVVADRGDDVRGPCGILRRRSGD